VVRDELRVARLGLYDADPTEVKAALIAARRETGD
jgi:hypothetical protein